jgi:hypothetical protein
MGKRLVQVFLNMSYMHIFNYIYHGNRVKKYQLDAQLILSIFRRPLHISGISRPIIRRYNHMYTTVGTYYSEKRIV